MSALIAVMLSYRGQEKKTWLRGCTGKVRHKTKEQADKALRHALSHGRRERASYPCGYCNGYHLTSAKYTDL